MLWTVYPTTQWHSSFRGAGDGYVCGQRVHIVPWQWIHCRTRVRRWPKSTHNSLQRPKHARPLWTYWITWKQLCDPRRRISSNSFGSWRWRTVDESTDSRCHLHGRRGWFPSSHRSRPYLAWLCLEGKYFGKRKTMSWQVQPYLCPIGCAILIMARRFHFPSTGQYRWSIPVKAWCTSSQLTWDCCHEKLCREEHDACRHQIRRRGETQNPTGCLVPFNN